MDAETQNIFLLGLAILFGWMLVVLICASPQLFRDCLRRRLCCGTQQRQNEEKIKVFLQAEARLQATLALAEKPSSFLLGQGIAMSNIIKPGRRSLHSLPLEEMEEGDVFHDDEPGPSSA